MNYIWQELCRQRNALARLMLGSLPREESAVQPAVRSESFAEQGTMLEEMDADYPATGGELERGIPAAEAAWMDVELKEEPGQEGFFQVWNLKLSCQEKGVTVGARVGITRSGNSLLTQETYHLLSADGLAVDHGCIITQALLYLKERLETVD